MSKAMPGLKVLFLCTGNSCRSQMAEGVAFSALVVSHGLGPQTRRLEMKREGCANCGACPAYRTCYDFGMAQLFMNTLLANGWYGT